jgi:hypothetical protein
MGGIVSRFLCVWSIALICIFSLPSFAHAASPSLFRTLWCGATSFFGYPCVEKVAELPYVERGPQGIVLSEETSHEPLPSVVNEFNATYPVTVVYKPLPVESYTVYSTQMATKTKEEIVYVLEKRYEKQIDKIYDILHDSMDDKMDAIAESFETLTIHVQGALYDMHDLAGTPGQVLTSTGSGVEWTATSTFAGNISLEDLNDVGSMSKAIGDLLTWNGTGWTNIATSSLGHIAPAEIDTSAELTALISDETGTGSLVFSSSPVFGGTAVFSTTSHQGNLSLLGSASNIALGSNWISGDGGDEGIFIDAAGRVGVGTSSPDAALYIESSEGTPFQIRVTTPDSYTDLSFLGTGNSYSVGTGNAAETFYGVANKFYVYDSNNDAMRLVIDENGSVGIGTTTPQEELTVAGDVYISGNVTVEGLNDGCVEVSSGLLTSTGVNCGTGSGGVTSFNGLTSSSQTFASSTAGSDFRITSAGSIHTLHMPSASASSRGLLTSAYWTSFNGRVATSAINTLAKIETLTGVSNILIENDIDASTELAALMDDESGSGALVFATSPTLVTPNLGTPTSITLSNATGLPISTGVSGLGSGIADWLSTPSSANLASAVTGETGSGNLVFSASPAFSGTTTFSSLTATGSVRVNGSRIRVDDGTMTGKYMEFWHDGTRANISSNFGEILMSSAVRVNTVNITSTGIYGSTGSALRLGSNGSATQLYIATNGNIGVGTSTPQKELQVHTGSDGGGLGVSFTDTSASYGGVDFLDTTSGHNKWSFGVNADSYAVTAEQNAFYVYQNYNKSEVAVDQYRLYINDAGNVGIGTTSPTDKLEVVGGGIQIGNSRYLSGRTSGGVSALLIGMNGSSDTRVGQINNTILYAGNTERARLSSAGNLGIGTTTPVAQLSIASSTTGFINIGAAGTSRIIFGSSATTTKWVQDNSSGTFRLFNSTNIQGSSGSVRLSVSPNGNVTVGSLTGSRLVATDGSSNLASTITAANLVSSVTGGTIWHSANDGAGSTLDADLLDGISSAGFTEFTDLDTCAEFAALGAIETGTCGSLVLSASPTFTGTVAGAAADFTGNVDAATMTEAGSAVLSVGNLDTCTEFAALGAIETGTCGSLVLSASPAFTGTVTIAGSTAWHAGNDGAGTGLDADLLDGISSGSFWQPGNDGAGSTLDADLLDGISSASFAQLSGANFTGDISIGTSDTNPAGNNVVGAYIDAVGIISVNASNARSARFGRTNDGAIMSFHSAGTLQGEISISGTGVTYGPFTGSHYTLLEGTAEFGELVTLTGNNKNYHDNPKSEVLYGVKRSSKENDSQIMGAYLGLLEPLQERSVDNPDQVAAVGNGDMWVVDKGEDLAVGDYLISSNVPGHARKDPQTATTSYIVARVAEPVDWSDVNETVGGVKHKRVSVFFESFTQNNWNVLFAHSDITSSTEDTLNYLLASPEDTVWTRLASLAESFVDGALVIVGLKSEFVESEKVTTDLLCVGEICVTEDEFRDVFGEQSAQLPDSDEEDPSDEIPPEEEETGTSTPSDEVEEVPVPEDPTTPEPVPEPIDEPLAEEETEETEPPSV